MLVGLKSDAAKTIKPDGLVSKVTDFEARINGKIVWSTYPQEDFKVETSDGKSWQLRTSEKVDGSLKIVCSSFKAF